MLSHSRVLDLTLTEASMTKLDWNRVKTPLGSIAPLRQLSRPATQKQWDYLNSLALDLGYPNARRLVADFTNQDAAVLQAGRYVVNSCIKQAIARLAKQAKLKLQDRTDRSRADRSRQRG